MRLARRSMSLARGACDRVELHSTLLLGVAMLFAGDYDEGIALIEQVDMLEIRNGPNSPGGQPHPYLGAALARAGRHGRARELLTSLIAEARSAGAADMLPYALVRLAGVELDTGRWRVAAAALTEARQLAQETGNGADHGLALGALAWLEAAQGHAGACRAHVEEALELAGRLGGGSRLDRAAAALGLLGLGCGRPERAIAPLEEVGRLQQENGWSDAALTPHRLPDLIEAYALAGRTGEAEAAVAAFSLDAVRTRRPSALALATRCRALLAPDPEVDARFDDALGTSPQITGPFERARTQLLYGWRLAKAGRSVEATDPLSASLRTFEQLGAEPWAERARRHPRRGRCAATAQRQPTGATGATRARRRARRRRRRTLDDIAYQLFLGPRTTRLLQASAMAKLGVDSTAELVAALGPERTRDARVGRQATA
jgi:tetratricopeptide (TPR) repeat protein